MSSLGTPKLLTHFVDSNHSLALVSNKGQKRGDLRYHNHNKQFHHFWKLDLDFKEEMREGIEIGLKEPFNEQWPYYSMWIFILSVSLLNVAHCTRIRARDRVRVNDRQTAPIRHLGFVTPRAHYVFCAARTPASFTRWHNVPNLDIYRYNTVPARWAGFVFCTLLLVSIFDCLCEEVPTY